MSILQLVRYLDSESSRNTMKADINIDVDISRMSLKTGHKDIDIDMLQLHKNSSFHSKSCMPFFGTSCAIFAIWGVPQMAFPVSERKIRDHFYRPNYPPKPRKNYLRNTFCLHQKCFFFWAFFNFAYFCLVFRV